MTTEQSVTEIEVRPMQMQMQMQLKLKLKLKLQMMMRTLTSRPWRRAWLMPSMAASASAGIRIRSAPASKASTAASAGPWRAAIASITRASVTTSPLNPSSRRNRSVSTLRERVAGRSGSSCGSSR